MVETIMIQVYFSDLTCEEGTNEVGSDEPYVLVATVNLAASVTVQGIAFPLPASNVFLYCPLQ